MISSTDFIHIPYTPDMTKAGVTYTCHWLIHQNNSLNTPLYQHLRSIVAGKAVELSFRRYLVEHQIPHQNLSSTKFSDPDRYDISLSGRRCELYSVLLSQKKVIRQAHSNPDELLIAQVSLPSELVASELLSEHDLYIFSFVTALVTGNRRQLRLALVADQPVFPIYLLPKIWSRPTPWASLGKLTLKSENIQPLKLVLGGQVANMQLNMEELELSPGLRTQVCSDFYSLSYMEVSPVSTGRVGVHSRRLSQTMIIQPNNWGISGSMGWKSSCVGI
jgi:hypothetical protein